MKKEWLKRGVAKEEGLPTARTVKGALAGGITFDRTPS